MKLAIKEQIEDLRIQMQKIAVNKTLTDPGVVKASERLDVLINEFYIGQKYLNSTNTTSSIMPK